MTTKRKPLISGNWKMHLNHFEALKLVQELSYLVTEDDVDAVDVSVHPPFTDIRTVQTAIDSRSDPVPRRGPALPLRGQGCLHRRGRPVDAGQAQRHAT